MSGLRPRGLEKGGTTKPTKMVKEGCMEEAELGRSSIGRVEEEKEGTGRAP